MNHTVLVLACVLALPFLACGNDDKKTVVTPPPDETAFSLPFSSSFEEAEELRNSPVWWTTRGLLALKMLGWQRDSIDAASGKYSVVVGREEGRGITCYDSQTNECRKCFGTDILRTKKPIDFSGTLHAQLRFMNTRTVRTRVAPPSCWRPGTQWSGGSTIAFRVVWLEEDEPPITTVPWEWHQLASFTTGTGWEEERIDLSVLAGKKAYIGFWEPDQCISCDSTSTIWSIDNVVVQ